MIKKFSILFTFSFIIGSLTNINSQTIDAKNTTYFELAGKGLYYSFNYERNIIELNDKLSLQASIGFSLFPGMTDIKKSTDFTMPLELNFRYALDNNHNIVAGYGTTLYKYKLNDIDISNANLSQEPLLPQLKDVKEWFSHIVIEYRFQKPEGGLMYKAGFSPLQFAKMENFAYQKKMNWAFSMNFGIGYAF
ncbi:MAG: hypothetical protein ACI9N1_000018 [Flavobacteriales bacterium]|jgi:hypothetical protein